MELNNIEWIWFDLDDTLLPCSRYYDQALVDIGVDPASKPYRAAKQKAKATLGHDHVSSHSRLIYLKYWMSEQGTYSSQALLHTYDQYCDKLNNYLKDYVAEHELFHKLSAIKKKYKLAIITNETLHMQTRKLMVLDPVGELFDFVVTSEEAGVEKPDTQIFQVALDRSKAKPEQVLMIGDSWKADILGATSLGIQAIYAGTELGECVPSSDAEVREDIFKVFEYL